MKKSVLKKICFGVVVLLLSVNSANADKIDMSQIKAILDKYYDVCDYEYSRGVLDVEQKSIDALKPFTYTTDNRFILNALDRCQSSIGSLKHGTVHGKKPDLTKIKKLVDFYYDSNNGVYKASYYYYKAQEDLKGGFIEKFRALKNKDGKIVLKLI